MERNWGLTDPAVAAAAAGDVVARDQVVEAARGPARLHVLLELAPGRIDPNFADDILQEVLLALTVGLPRLQHQTAGGLKAFLAGIVKHKVQKALAAKPRAAAGLPLAALCGPAVADATQTTIGAWLAADTTGPATKAERGERLAQILAAMGQLSDGHREALRLAFFENLETGEIAERLDCSRNAAAMLLLRSVRALRAQLPPSTAASSIWDGEKQDGGAT